MNSYVCINDIEEAAIEKMPKTLTNYIRSGASSQQTIAENKAAYKRLRIRPRVLRNVSNIDMSLEVFGAKVTMPVGISPSAGHRLIHPDGEDATAKAAGTYGAVYIMGSFATTSIEDVAKVAPNTIKWLQIVISRDRLINVDFVRRAEINGFQAIVVTLDIPIIGTRWTIKDKQFIMPPPFRLSNYVEYFKKNKENDGVNDGILVRHLEDPSVTWEDFKWLKSITKLPLVAKGILTAEDAKLAVEAGCSAVFVSNHGGRQLDGTPATIEALPEIVNALKDTNVPIFLDGGIKEGTDVFKALALGAKMVFIGRQPLYGLAVGGQQGVEKVLSILKTELEETLALTGCRDLGQIKKEMVVHHSYYERLCQL